MSAMLACELAPRPSACRPFPALPLNYRGQPARCSLSFRASSSTLGWLSARGVHDAMPVLTAHPTALTAEVHFRRSDAYWLVLCQRAGRLLRAAETPFRVEGVVLPRRTRIAGPWQAERALVSVPSEFLADGAGLYATQAGPRNWDRLSISPHPERLAPFIVPCAFPPGGERRGRSG